MRVNPVQPLVNQQADSPTVSHLAQAVVMLCINWCQGGWVLIGVRIKRSPPWKISSAENLPSYSLK